MNLNERFFDLISKNLKNPKFYAVVLVLIFVLLLLFPYIDANFFYYNRVEKRVNILKEFSEIDYEALKDNPTLEGEYQSILSEIDKQKSGSISSIFITESTKQIKTYKFLSGGILFWLLSLLCLFIKMNGPMDRVLGVIIFAIMGGAFGCVALLLPTIISPLCNYIFVPLIEVVVFIILITSGSTFTQK